MTNPKIPIILVLDRLRSAHNVGNIFRIADAVNAMAIYGCGYTPMPGHPKLAKTAMGSEMMVETRTFPDAVTAIQTLKTEGIVRKVIAVEPTEDAICAWDFPWEYPVALVLGNEALGIHPDALALCDGKVALPMLGQKASINVGNCAAVTVYAALKNYLQHPEETHQ